MSKIEQKWTEVVYPDNYRDLPLSKNSEYLKDKNYKYFIRWDYKSGKILFKSVDGKEVSQKHINKLNKTNIYVKPTQKSRFSKKRNSKSSRKTSY